MENIRIELDKLYDRLPTVFNLNENNEVSSILLFKDYFYKLRSWKNLLEITYPPYGFSTNYLSNNLLVDINQNLRDKMIDIKDFYEIFQTNYPINNQLVVSRYMNYFFIYSFIYWEVLKNESEFDDYKNARNPYLGLVKLLSNDSIYIREGVNIAGVTINFNKNLELPSLDDNFLKFIDGKYTLQLGSKIPNQEEVNILWEEFQKL